MRRRDDAGAVAVMVALLLVVLFGIAAIVVDLGRAYVEKQDVQKDTDFAALAGAAASNLPGTTGGACSYGLRAAATDQAVQDVASYLTSDVAGSDRWAEAPSAQGLVDCSLANGEVLYGTATRNDATGLTLAYDPYHLTVVSPRRDVDFGFAKLLGVDDAQVSARATAAIKSPTVNSVPLYAFTGCDWGRQTIAQPNNGHASSTVKLSHGEEKNAARLVSLATEPATDPATIPTPPPDPAPLTIYGERLGTVTDVGFFESGASGPGPEPVIVGSAAFARSATSIRLGNVPAAVTTVPGDWYVRVKIGDSWSAVTDSNGNLTALRLLVGTPTLTCGQGSSGGNFGTLRLAHSAGGGQSQQIARNIAGGLEHTLAVHPSPSSDGTCSANQPAAVLWSADGTNCVDTDPGMAADAAQAGFISGVGSYKGRLANLDPGSGCAESGTPSTTLVSGVVINNDTLSCFLTDDSTNVGTISSASYSGGPVLSAAIYKSPRFMIIPVLKVEPAKGSSRMYQIVDFRPAFLTDQPNSATRTTPANPGNGLTVNKHGVIESVQVVFINSNALPPMDAPGTTDYAGTGPRVIRMVD